MKNKKVRIKIHISQKLLKAVEENVIGADLSEKISKCLSVGYEALVTIKQLSDEELKKRFTDIHEPTYVIQYFSTKDLPLLNLYEQELHNRGYEIQEYNTIEIVKKVKP